MSWRGGCRYGMSLLWPRLALPEVQKADSAPRQRAGVGLAVSARPVPGLRAPISSRYPLVEFVTGLAFAVLAYVELVRAGVNLPGVVPESSTGLLVVWSYHSLLASLLIVAALFDWDGVLVPPRLIILGLVAGLFLPLYSPGLYPTDELGDFAEPGLGFSGVLLGLALGVLTLWVVDGPCRGHRNPVFAPRRCSGLGGSVSWSATGAGYRGCHAGLCHCRAGRRNSVTSPTLACRVNSASCHDCIYRCLAAGSPTSAGRLVTNRRI